MAYKLLSTFRDEMTWCNAQELLVIYICWWINVNSNSRFEETKYGEWEGMMPVQAQLTMRTWAVEREILPKHYFTFPNLYEHTMINTFMLLRNTKLIIRSIPKHTFYYKSTLLLE